jgi:hypothetical protein
MLRAESLPEDWEVPTPSQAEDRAGERLVGKAGDLSASSSGTVSLADTAYSCDGSGGTPLACPAAAKKGGRGKPAAQGGAGAKSRRLR